MFIQPEYNFTFDDKHDFPVWFEDYYPRVAGMRNTFLNQILITYDRSYLLGMIEPQFVMLMTILESVFGSGNSEITYQVSRGIALVLSKSENEMKAIYAEMKKLYDVRSKYVHRGKEIDCRDLFLLRELIRRLMLKLIDLGYNQEDSNLQQLRDQITYSGAGLFNQK